MIIESIELKNYRNYKELHMEFNQGTNILYGDNAQGKTNILEAVYVCCTSNHIKALRTGISSVLTRMNPILNYRSGRTMCLTALTCT